MSDHVIATNRKAFHEFSFTEKIEAGVALQGTEVKSARAGKVNLSDGWVDLESGEAILREVHIGHYSHGNIMNHIEKRPRRLLLNQREIVKLRQKSLQGMSVIPLQMYFSGGGFIKIELGVGKGKKKYDKREAIKEHESNRAIARALKKG